MKKSERRKNRRPLLLIAVFLLVNILAVFLLGNRELSAIERNLFSHAQNTQQQFEDVFEDYQKSFQVFSQMMAREIENNPDPDAVWDYLKGIDASLLEIEGETFDGLYMYYKGMKPSDKQGCACVTWSRKRRPGLISNVYEKLILCRILRQSVPQTCSRILGGEDGFLHLK